MTYVPKDDQDPATMLREAEKTLHGIRNGSIAVRPDPRFATGGGGADVSAELLMVDWGDGPQPASYYFDMGMLSVGGTPLGAHYALHFMTFSPTPTLESGLHGPDSSAGSWYSPNGDGVHWDVEVQLIGDAIDRLEAQFLASGYGGLVILQPVTFSGQEDTGVQADVQIYLSNEPGGSGPPTAGYYVGSVRKEFAVPGIGMLQGLCWNLGLWVPA